MEAIKWPDKHFRLAATVLQKVTQGLGFLASSAPSLVLSCVYIWSCGTGSSTFRMTGKWRCEVKATYFHWRQVRQKSQHIISSRIPSSITWCPLLHLAVSHCKTLAGWPWVHCELNYCKGENGFGWEISNFCQREYRKIKWAPIIIKAWRPNVDVTGRFYSANLSVQFDMHNEIKCFREMIWIC